MRCGAKCFSVQFASGAGEKQTKPVIARTPAEARKIFRNEHGKGMKILSVRQEKDKLI